MVDRPLNVLGFCQKDTGSDRMQKVISDDLLECEPVVVGRQPLSLQRFEYRPVAGYLFLIGRRDRSGKCGHYE